jgi:chromosome segregation ATPase
VISSAAEVQGIHHRLPASDGALAGMQLDRDRLTHLLRSLATELDGLDRRLSDITWQHARPTGAAVSDTRSERTALEAQREQLTARLHVMAGQLNHLDLVLSDLRGHEQLPTARVGTCPQCGYPSLGSGLCAYCRPQLLDH